MENTRSYSFSFVVFSLERYRALRGKAPIVRIKNTSSYSFSFVVFSLERYRALQSKAPIVRIKLKIILSGVGEETV